MALGHNKPKFEDESQAGAATATEEAPKSNPTLDPAAAGVEATKAIATAATTAVALPSGSGFKDVYKKYEGVISDLEFGTLARLVGSNGRILAKQGGSKNTSLGDTIKVTLVSFNDTWQVTPGEDKPEAKKYVKYSKDGETIDGTNGAVTVKDYLKQLIEVDGYPKASLKQYTSLVGILESTSDISPAATGLVGEMVEVSLSPTAAKKFRGLRMQRSVKVARGVLQDDGSEVNLVVRAEVGQNGANEYTALAVSEK